MTVFCERTLLFDYGSNALKRELSHRFPVITEHFRSPMVDERNLQLGTGALDDELLTRVLDGLKPVGFLDSRRQEPMRAAAVRALDAGCAARHQCSSGVDFRYWFTSVAQTGRIRERFDLEALNADYRAYFPAHPDVAAAIEQEFALIACRDISDYLAFADVEVRHGDVGAGHAHLAGELAREGCCSGIRRGARPLSPAPG